MDSIEKLVLEYETVFNGSQDCLFLVEVIDPETFRYLRVNETYRKDTGVTNEDIEGKTPIEVWGNDTGGIFIENYKRCVALGAPYRYEEAFPSGDTDAVIQSVLTPVYDNRKIEYLVGSSRNITEQRKAEEELKINYQRLENILEGANIGTWEMDIPTGKMTYNERWAEMIGYTLEELENPTTDGFEARLHPDDLRKAQLDIDRVLSREISEYETEFRMRHKNGSWVFIKDKGRVVKWAEDGTPLMMTGIHIDLTDMKKRQEEIEYLSFRDQLTGLYNRRFLEEELQRLDTSRNLPLSVAMVDVNGLKLTNDAFGHAAGDKLLIQIADIMKSECRSDDIIARTGGDEFVLLFPQTDSLKTETIVKRIRNRFKLAHSENMPLSAAIGWETKVEIPVDIEAVLRKAEEYMYRRKLRENSNLRQDTLGLIMQTLFEKNETEKDHAHRVSELSVSLARELELSNDTIENIEEAGKVHDIGKIGIDYKILEKPDSLNSEEWNEMKRHAEIGYRILSSIDVKKPVANQVLEHHERWDGTGYPSGLTEDEISIEARILAIVEAYDTMTNETSYRGPMTQEEAISELRRHAGSQFDPSFIEIFIKKVLKQ